MVGHRHASSTGGSRSSCVLFGRLRRRAITCVFALQVVNLVSRGFHRSYLGRTAIAAAVTATVSPLDEEDTGDGILHFDAPQPGITPHLSLKHKTGPAADAVLTRTMLGAGPEFSVKPELFSANWATEFAMGVPGCNLARAAYQWRNDAGFGSNINNLLNGWVHALAIKNSDLAVMTGDGRDEIMSNITCDKRSLGHASKGWECLFRPMPHLCLFPSILAWGEHMSSNNVNATEVEKYIKDYSTLPFVRNHPGRMAGALKSLEVDYLGAIAVLAKYLWSNITPWLMADVNLVTRTPVSPVSSAFERAPFLAIHVRRGDKIVKKQAKRHNCKEYLELAVRYMEDGSNTANVEDIRGIWVASDDSTVVEKVKQLAPNYFPNVESSMIEWISGGVQGGPKSGKIATRGLNATYADAVYVFADLQQCMLADVFVGTFSSNVGKLVVLLRESVGHKERGSALSVDVPKWKPGRQR